MLDAACNLLQGKSLHNFKKQKFASVISGHWNGDDCGVVNSIRLSK